jgi:hypothetical protein
MEPKLSQFPNPYVSRDESGNLQVSPNNRESPIAFYFDFKDTILSFATVPLEASLLSEDTKIIFIKVFKDAMQKVVEEAAGMGRSDRDKFSISLTVLSDLSKGKPLDLDGTEKKEWDDVVRLISEQIFKLTTGDAIYEWFVEKQNDKTTSI